MKRERDKKGEKGGKSSSCGTENCRKLKFDQFLNYGPSVPVAHHDQIWREMVNLWRALPCEISASSVYTVAPAGPKTDKIRRF